MSTRRAGGQGVRSTISKKQVPKDAATSIKTCDDVMDGIPLGENTLAPEGSYDKALVEDVLARDVADVPEQPEVAKNG